MTNRPGDPGSAAAWDAFVEANPVTSYLQLSGWARVKAVNGWRAVHPHDAGDASVPALGAQILLRRPGLLPWAFAYAPRGPVLDTWDAPSIARFTEFARGALRPRGLAAARVSHLRIDPEVECDGPLDVGGTVRDALRASGWREAPAIQPVSTRVIDLTAPEDSLWGDLRKKWRQYVNKARSGGVRVVEADATRLPEFYRIYRETADRAGFLIRAESAYRDVWDAFASQGRVRLLFAELPDGEPAACLFLVRSGRRVVEPYGGMTAAGADSRANYLLKWEAIRSSREAGAEVYDLWGLAHPGIAHFKTGFGGREITYVGAWDLVLDPLGRRVFGAAQDARVRVARLRHGLRGGGAPASAYGGDGPAAGGDGPAAGAE